MAAFLPFRLSGIFGRAAARVTPGERAKDQELMPPAISTERDLRLDLFRGVALWLIFLGHLPNRLVSWITIRNYGFSDDTEIFICSFGYTAAFVYGKAMHDRGFIVASARIL